MFELIQLRKRIANILSIFFKDLEPDEYIHPFQPKSSSKETKQQSFDQGFYNKKYAVWRENLVEDSFMGTPSLSYDGSQENNNKVTFYKINALRLPNEYSDPIQAWEDQKKKNLFYNLYLGVSTDKQAFCLYDRYVIIVDETVIFVMNLKLQTQEQFKIPKELRKMKSKIKIKAIFMNQETKFLVFKHTSNSENKMILFQPFQFKKGKIEFNQTHFEFKPDRRLRWKCFYNQTNRLLILPQYTFLMSQGLIYISDRKTGKVIQNIGMKKLKNEQFNQQNNIEQNTLDNIIKETPHQSNQLIAKTLHNKFLFLQQSDTSDIFVIMERDRDFDKLNHIFNASNDLDMDPKLAKLLITHSKQTEEEHQKVYQELYNYWSLDFSDIALDDIQNFDWGSQKILRYIILSNIIECPYVDYLKFSLHFLVKYDLGKLLRLVKILQVLQPEIERIIKRPLESFLEKKVPFLQNEHYNMVYVKDESDQLVCEEYYLVPNRFSYRNVLRRVFGIKV